MVRKVALGVLTLLLVFMAAAYIARNISTRQYFLPSQMPPSSSQTGSPVATSTATPQGTVRILDVPFTPQAPYGDWDDARQQDGCEEASSLMAVRWAQGKELTKDEALREILAISDYEEATYGNYHDTDAKDTLERIIKGYFKFEGAQAQGNIDTDDIKDALYEYKLVIVPVNGQKLGNPHFTQPGPERHMLVVIGYDPKSNEFITNDPGTRKGQNYRYTAVVLQNALEEYPTGYHIPLFGHRTAMITVEK